MKNSIQTIDCQYLYPEFAAAYLYHFNGEALFVDNNTAHSVPLLLAELKAKALTPEQVRYIIITHVHLDHAGGTATLMNACPNAKLLCHPRAARHMIDPTKLEAGARAVYGDEKFEKIYGSLAPVAADRVQTIDDGGCVDFANDKLRFIHTRGHANHHFCIYSETQNAIFTGDSFGLSYPALQAGGRFIFPSTSPTDFHAEEAIKSYKSIVDTGSDVAYLTHFGAVRSLAGAMQDLKEWVEFSQDLIEQMKVQCSDKNVAQNFAIRALAKRFKKEFAAKNLPQTLWNYVELDLNLNAQGLVHSAFNSVQK